MPFMQKNTAFPNQKLPLENVSHPFIRGPSYQNESSDSVSRKLLDQFKDAFNTKYIDLFHATFVTTISLNTTIHSINQINLSSFMHYPNLFPFCNNLTARAKLHRAWQCILHAFRYMRTKSRSGKGPRSLN